MLGLGAGTRPAYAAQPSARPAAREPDVRGLAERPDRRATAAAQTPPDIDLPAARARPAAARPDRTIGNDLARGRTTCRGLGAYAGLPTVRRVSATDAGRRPLTPRRPRQTEIRFRPPDEPTVGGYSLRVEGPTTASSSPDQMVATKIVGLRDHADADFQLLDSDAVGGILHLRRRQPTTCRYNYFQWFAAPGSSTATLEIRSPAASADVPG